MSKNRRITLIMLLICAANGTIAQTARPAPEPLTIHQAVALASANNERSQIASQQVRAAEARVNRARTSFFPDVTVNGGYTARGGDSNVGGSGGSQSDGLNGNLRVSQTLFDARAFPLYRYARLVAESARASGSSDRRDLAFDAAEQFVVTLNEQRFAEAAERRRDLAKAAMEDARARVEAGLVSRNDLTRADLELNSAALEVARARGRYREALFELSGLLAVSVTGPLSEPDALLEEARSGALDPDAAFDVAVKQRPDLVALRTTAAALKEYAKEPSMRFFPTFILDTQLRLSGEGLSQPDTDGSAALNLGWNVFDGGERRAETVERNALASVASLNADAAERRVDTELRTAATNISVEREASRLAEAAATAARRNAQETGELYRQGLATSLERTDANVRRFEAELAESRARYQLVLALLNWRAAVGATPVGSEVE